MSYTNELLIKEDTLGELADAIRERTGNSESMSPDEMITTIKIMTLNNQEGGAVTSVNGMTGDVVLNAADVGADASGTASSAVSTHNTSTSAHSDIRLLIEGLTTRLNALANSDDTTLDQMSEIVAYIKNNKALIEQVTTNKVNVSDIINNLTTNVSNKPLSAAQGVVLKGLIDAVSNSLSNYALKSAIPTNVSQLTNDAGYLTKHQDISGKLDRTELPAAINTALAQAAASGEFDGKDGRGIKSIVRTSGNGAAGTTDTYTITYTDNTAGTLTVYNGKNGTNGTSVTVKSVSESSADGGSNVVTFSDGTTITIKNGQTGASGKTPVRGTDYWTSADKAEIEAYLATELAKRGQLAPEYADSVEWLNENGDQSKMYVLPDGFIHAWMLTEKEVTTGSSYKNLLPLAVQSDGKTPYVGDNVEKGYRPGYRLNSSRAEVQAAGRTCTGFIPVKYNDTVRLKNIKNPTDGNINGYVHFYGSDLKASTGMMYEQIWNSISVDGVASFVPSQVADINSMNMNASRATAYMRISTGTIDNTTIITVNEEIVEGNTEIITEYAWVNTGLAFVPADYEGRILDLETQSAQNTADIADLKKGKGNVTAIKDWDAPIYDAHIPVFELSAEKVAMTNATNTPANIYAKYDALMAKHPRYITKTDLGLCSDGVNHVYRYDFREPEPLHESNKEWSETKAKAIIVTGIHFEWAGIYAMYNALEEIADNPNLRNFRRNTHLIVIPVANPFATIAANYDGTNGSQGVRNANGVEIHRNFEVDWIASTAGTTHYGGSAPLSEVETQYIDNVLKNNTDAAFFLSCHNCGVDTFWGTGFIWASTATKYMCNMGYRVIDKLSDAWMDKYGDVLSAGIAEYKTAEFADGETRLGFTGLSTSPGTEAKQATKYGIQGTNVEICNPFQIHGTKANPEPSMSAFTMSRGAEVYVNFLLTAFGAYDPKDKALYR